MTTAFRTFALLATLTLASGASAQTPNSPAPTGQVQLGTSGPIELQKDPAVAMFLSASLPGLGQLYTGDKKRGFLFMASVLGAFGAAYASYEPALLHLADYDRTLYGGNGDGLLSTLEAQNWQERRFAKTAFDSLSSGRKAGVITGVAVGAGLYLWNILDARTRAHDHNRELVQRRVSVALDASRSRVGVAVGLNF